MADGWSKGILFVGLVIALSPPMRIISVIGYGLSRLALFIAILGHSFAVFANENQSAGTPFSYFRERIEDGRIKDRAELIAAMPASMKSNFVLMEHSNSTVVSSTAANPRIIFFDPKSSLIITVSGNLNHPDGNIVEVAEGGAIPQPRAIVFGTGNDKPRIIENPLEAFRRSPTKNCVSCHGENFRYLWTGVYPRWPGAYAVQWNEGGILDREAVAQAVKLKQFFDSTTEHPIYGQLDRSMSKYHSLSNKTLNFNHLLRQLADQRASQELRQHPRFAEYQPVLTWASQHRVSLYDSKRENFLKIFASQKVAELLPAGEGSDFNLQLPHLIDARLAGLLRDASELSNLLGFEPIAASRFANERLGRNLIYEFVAEKMGINPDNWYLNAKGVRVENDGFGRPLNNLRFHDEAPPRKSAWQILCEKFLVR